AACAAATIAERWSSPATRPWKSMTSPRASTSGPFASSVTSAGVMEAFGGSMSGDVAGTQLKTAENTRRGRPREASTIHLMPGAPSTLATSCESCSTAVVPRTSAASAKRPGAAGRDEADLDVHVDVDHAGLHVGAAQVDRLPGLDLAAPRAVALLDLDEAPAQHGEPAPEHRLGDDVDDVRALDEQVAVRAADV